MAGWPLLPLIFAAAGAWAQTATISEPAAVEESVFPKLQWSGDIRVRGMLEKDGDEESRLNPRIRVRVGVGADIQKNIRGEIRMASAKGHRSANQSLGDSSEPGSRRRFIGLDLAYAKWSPVSFGSLYAGRFSQIHFAPGASELILDDDLALEGAGVSSSYEFLPSFHVIGSAGSTFIRENYDTYYSEDLSDNMLNFGQLALRWPRLPWQFTMGGGFFNFTGVQGRNFSDLAVGGTASGNTESAGGAATYPYLPIQYFAELKAPLGALDLKLFYEFVHNDEAPRQNKAQWLGMEAGQSKWDVGLGYTEVESDAVLAMFTASDIGDGVTDVKGWVGKARWRFAKNMNLKLTQLVNRTDMTGTYKEYRRTQLDLNASF